MGERFAWVIERLTWDDAEFLQKLLGRELELEVPGYGWVIGVHGGPGNDEFGMNPHMPADELLDVLSDQEGRLVLCGHTHKAMDRDLGAWRVVNVGSVGLPMIDTRASYALLTFEGDSLNVDLRHVAFDSEAVIADLEANKHPDADWIAPVLRTGKED